MAVSDELPAGALVAVPLVAARGGAFLRAQHVIRRELEASPAKVLDRRAFERLRPVRDEKNLDLQRTRVLQKLLRAGNEPRLTPLGPAREPREIGRRAIQHPLCL